MSGSGMRSLGLALMLVPGCAGGDLTLPSSGRPTAIHIVSGDGQQAQAGAMLEEPLVVRILDGSNRPVPRAPVEFGFVGELPGAGLDPPSALTNEDGRASAVVRLGTVTGEQHIVASLAATEAADLRARFSATALDPDDGGGGKGGGKKDRRGKGHGDDDEGDDEDDE